MVYVPGGHSHKLRYAYARGHWKLELAPKIAGNWDFVSEICWDLGISQKLTGIVKNNWLSKVGLQSIQCSV